MDSRDSTSSRSCTTIQPSVTVMSSSTVFCSGISVVHAAHSGLAYVAAITFQLGASWLVRKYMRSGRKLASARNLSLDQIVFGSALEPIGRILVVFDQKSPVSN